MRFFVFLRRHPGLAFVTMGAAFVCFALATWNLVYLFRANFALIAEHGVMSIADGAGVQLLQLLFWGATGLVLYLVFKACEKILVDRLTREP